MAATGGSSFVCGSQASNDERTCFTFTVPGVSTLAWFSVREISDMPGGLNLATTDGEIPDVVVAPYASGAWRRGFASASPATDRGWTFCYRKNGSGQSLDTAWLDDIQFE